jgi:NTE family protein
VFGDTKVGFKDGELQAPSALVEGQRIEPVLQRLFGKVPPTLNFDSLPIRYRAVAADIENGETVVIDRGNLSQAARASMAVPGVFSPVEREGRLLVDGGITNNFPVDVALAMHPDVLIAVHFNYEFRTREKLTNPLAILGQMMDLLLERSTEERLQMVRKSDILIVPDLKGFASTSFTHAQEIMAAGEAAAEKVIPSLKRLALSEEEYREFQTHRSGMGEYQPSVGFVEVRGLEKGVADKVESELRAVVGQPFDRARVEEVIGDAFDGGEYRKISLDIEEREGEAGLIIDGRKKEWLDNFVRLGFALEDDFEGESSYALALDWQRRNVNSTGGRSDIQLEVGRSPRVFGEFYQPFGPEDRFFFAPEASVGQQDLLVRDSEGEVVAKYERRAALIGLKGGVDLREYGELAAGWRRGPGRLSKRIGDSSLPEFDYDIGESFVDLDIDQLDNPDFPTSGYRFTSGGAFSREGLGADADFNRGAVSAQLPITAGDFTVLIFGEGGIASDDLPPERLSVFGGIFDIAGYTQGSLAASNYAIGRATVYHRFAKGGTSLFPFGGYVGGTFEFASLRSNIEEVGDHPDIVAGSLFLGVDTPVIPMYLGFGLSDESEHAFYLALGRPGSRRR